MHAQDKAKITVQGTGLFAMAYVRCPICTRARPCPCSPAGGTVSAGLSRSRCGPDAQWSVRHRPRLRPAQAGQAPCGDSRPGLIPGLSECLWSTDLSCLTFGPVVGKPRVHERPSPVRYSRYYMCRDPVCNKRYYELFFFNNVLLPCPVIQMPCLQARGMPAAARWRQPGGFAGTWLTSAMRC